MSLSATLTPFAPFIGAAALEVFYWFQLRRKLLPENMKAILRSPFYWIITPLAIIFGGFCAIILFPDGDAGRLLVAGAALPTLLKKLVSGLIKDQGPSLGEDDAQEKTAIRDYFTYA